MARIKLRGSNVKSEADVLRELVKGLSSKNENLENRNATLRQNLVTNEKALKRVQQQLTETLRRERSNSIRNDPENSAFMTQVMEALSSPKMQPVFSIKYVGRENDSITLNCRMDIKDTSGIVLSTARTGNIHINSTDDLIEIKFNVHFEE